MHSGMPGNWPIQGSAVGSYFLVSVLFFICTTSLQPLLTPSRGSFSAASPGQGEPRALGRRREVAAQADQSFGLAFGLALASTSASSFLKSSRPRRASKSGSFSSRARAEAQLARKSARRAATAWSANVAASSFVTPEFASPPSPASRASARTRSYRVSGYPPPVVLANSSAARRTSAAALDGWPDRTRAQPR